MTWSLRMEIWIQYRFIVSIIFFIDYSNKSESISKKFRKIGYVLNVNSKMHEMSNGTMANDDTCLSKARLTLQNILRRSTSEQINRSSGVSKQVSVSLRLFAFVFQLIRAFVIFNWIFSNSVQWAIIIWHHNSAGSATEKKRCIQRSNRIENHAKHSIFNRFLSNNQYFISFTWHFRAILFEIFEFVSENKLWINIWIVSIQRTIH